MPIHIKNCGLTTPATIFGAAETGAQFAGFVHYEKSPRHLPLEAIAKLVTIARQKMKTVVVLVDPNNGLLATIAQHIQPDFIQVHHVLSPARISEIATLGQAPVITGISVRDKNDLGYAAMLEGPSAYLLFDAKEPGSGVPFDWQLLRGLSLAKPWFLAGGLNAQNVAHAIHTARAPMVDVSSGIEEKPGVKSLEKIAAFNRAVIEAQ